MRVNLISPSGRRRCVWGNVTGAYCDMRVSIIAPIPRGCYTDMAPVFTFIYLSLIMRH